MFWLLYLNNLYNYWIFHWYKLLCLYYPSISIIYYIFYNIPSIDTLIQNINSPFPFLASAEILLIYFTSRVRHSCSSWNNSSTGRNFIKTYSYLFISPLSHNLFMFNICYTLSPWNILAVSWKACNKSKTLLAILQTLQIQQVWGGAQESVYLLNDLSSGSDEDGPGIIVWKILLRSVVL